MTTPRSAAVSPKIADEANALRDTFVGHLHQGLARSERYLKSRSPADLALDLMAFVQRHPLPFALGALGAGLGVLLSKPAAPRRAHHAH